MKLSKKQRIWSISLATVSVVSITIASTISVVETSKTMMVKNDHMVIKTNKESNINYNSYLKEVSFNKVDNDINNIINNESSNQWSIVKNSNIVLQENSKNNKVISKQQKEFYLKEVKEKASKLAWRIYDGSISLNNVVDQVKEHMKHLSFKQQQILNKKIKLAKKALTVNINDYRTHTPYNNYLKLYDQNTLNSFANVAQQDAKQINNTSTKLAWIAGVLTAAAIATSIVAAIDWTIPFWGWFYGGPVTTAAAINDWVAVGLSWAAYDKVNSAAVNVISIISDVGSGVLTAYDIHELVDSVRDYNNIVGDGGLDNLKNSLDADLVDNTADIAGDAANAATVVALDTIITFLDALVTVTGLSGIIIANTK